MQILSVAVAALFVAPSLQAELAKAWIYNNCSFDVNVWSVVAGDPGHKFNISANGGTYNETYRTPTIGGVSLKLTPEENCDNTVPITQFEYTVGGGNVFYDLSDINCNEMGDNRLCPFKKHGMFMHSKKGCPAVSCTKGARCADAYNAWNDDFATKACGQTSNIYLYLCATQLPAKASLKAIGETLDDLVDSVADNLPEIKIPSVKRHAHHARHPHWRS